MIKNDSGNQQVPQVFGQDLAVISNKQAKSDEFFKYLHRTGLLSLHGGLVSENGVSEKKKSMKVTFWDKV